MKCSICNKEIEKSKFTNAILCSNECHNDHFWIEKIKLHDDRTVVVDHTRWHFQPDDPSAYFKGMGEREFNIEFFDGRKVKTKNLWCQGDVPEKFWKQIPNNANFV
jgi:hypothetical protein